MSTPKKSGGENNDKEILNLLRKMEARSVEMESRFEERFQVLQNQLDQKSVKLSTPEIVQKSEDEKKELSPIFDDDEEEQHLRLLDTTRNFPAGLMNNTRSRRQSFDPGDEQYREAHMTVNMKKDIPVFENQLNSLTVKGVLSFELAVDNYMSEHYKASYKAGDTIDHILRFRDRIPESTRRILGMLVPDPSIIVEDKKWRALSNRQIMRIIRVALQPDSESDYAYKMTHNIDSQGLKDISNNLNVFNYQVKIPPLRKFFKDFGEVHTYLNMQGEALDKNTDVVSYVADVNCSSNGGLKLLRTLLTEPLGKEFTDALITMATSRLRLVMKSQSDIRTSVLAKKVSIRGKFTDVEEMLEYCTAILEDFVDSFKGLKKFSCFFRKRSFHNNSTNNNQLELFDSDTSWKRGDVLEDGDTSFNALTQAMDKKAQVCWMFLLNGECSLLKEGKTCGRSHDRKAVLEFAQSQLPKMINTVNKCVSSAEDKYILSRVKSRSATSTSSTPFQPSHRRFDKLHENEKQSSVKLLSRSGEDDKDVAAEKLTNDEDVEAGENNSHGDY